jgi:hypothetical protein
LGATRFAERSAQYELDLSIEAAQVIISPALDGGQDIRVDPQQECLAFSHIEVVSGEW